MMKRFIAVVVGAGVFGAASVASAAVPGLLNHQGRLYDSANQPVTGTVDMEFAIYTAESGGAPVWSEVHSITFDDGFYSVALGGDTPITNTFTGDVTIHSGIVNFAADG